LTSFDESSETVDTNKTGRSDKVHDIILDDDDSRNPFESTVKLDKARMEIYIIDNSWTMDIVSHISWFL